MRPPVLPRREGEPTLVVDPYLPEHGDISYDVTHYDLDLDYRVASNRLVGQARIAVRPRQRVEQLSLDLVDNLSVSRVLVDGVRARWVHRSRRLRITLPQPLAADVPAVVEVRWSGNPRPTRGRWGETGWEELTDGLLVAGQPDGAPTWVPCNDHPAIRAPWTTRVTCDSPYTVVANGQLVTRVVRGSRTTWTYEQVEPMSTYLASLQVGDYTVLELADGPVPMRAFVPARLRRAAEHDLSRQPRMMELFTQLFGPYPFAAYDVVVTDDPLEIPLESQGYSIFGANHCDGAHGHERLVAHELAHQWFGDALGVATWQHIWLNEGFACYAEWLWSPQAGGPSTDALARRHHGMLRAEPQDLVLSDPGADDMFDDRVYKRGALTLHALRLTLGDQAFGDLVRTWVADHRGSVVTTEMFVAHAVAYDATVRPLLKAWLEDTAVPPLPGRLLPSLRR